MTRTVCAVCLVIAAVCVGCAPKAAEPPAAQGPAIEQPAVESEQGGDSSVVASEGFETGSSETLQGAEKAATEPPAEAP
jgi:hypothetical protein